MTSKVSLKLPMDYRTKRGTQVPRVMFLTGMAMRPQSRECMSWHEVTTGW